MQSIELARPVQTEAEAADVERALTAIVLAASEATAAGQALAFAQTEVEIAKRAFLADPTTERNDAVEAAEKNLRSAQRLLEARKHQGSVADKLLAAAEQLKGEQDLDRLGQAREVLRRAMNLKLEELTLCSRQAGGIVAELESMASKDHQLCAAAIDAQKRAHIPGTIRPIELDTLLRAAQIMLSAGRPRPRSRKIHNPGMDLVLADLRRQSPPLTADEKAIVCSLALLEHARDGEASTGLWLTPAYRPLPQFLNTTAAASAHSKAIRLLDALQGEPQK